MTQVNPWRIAGWGMAGLLLLLPAVAMRFTSEVNWTASDFVVAAGMLGSVGLGLELTMRRSVDWSYRAGMILTLAAGFLLVWINGAVGIVGDEGNPFNLLYLGLVVLVAGWGLVTRFRANGMANATTVAAVATALIGVAGSYVGRAEPPGSLGILAINAFFVAVFAGAAILFRRAASTN